MSEGFPQSRTLFEQKGSPAQVRLARECFGAVDYHLRLCGDAVSGSALGMANFQVGIDGTTRDSYYIFGLNEPLSLTQWGDVAVQSAASVIEVAWTAMNEVLGLGIPATEPVRWYSKSGKPGPFQLAVKKIGGDAGRELTEAIERTFASAGYRLLSGYRNWASHRGAPVQEPDLKVLGPIPLPEEVKAETDPHKKERDLRWAATLYLSSAYTVVCWPIVPQIQMRYSLEVANADQDMQFPGVRIAKGASVQLPDVRIGVGSLWDPLDEHKKRNPIPQSSSKRSYAGEELAVYTGTTYGMALSRVENFVRQAVTTVLDPPLQHALWTLLGFDTP